ncbi:MAG: CRISPR-associated endonuclease Cas2 [Actinomycetaceae bacterium]|nr:CRISPR-associated endonuclease Cas2 [Actinomycetaceae bacterium]
MRIMRIIVMFDLPTASKEEKKKYALFRKFLLNDGYQMSQYSVYTRIALSRDNMESHIKRLQDHVPDVGEVTVLALTEKQYASRKILVNTKKPNPSEERVGEQLTLFF